MPCRDEFVIGGYTDPQGRRTGLGALIVGTYENGKLRYRGWVGTGLGQRELGALQARLHKLSRPQPPFAAVPRYHPKGSSIHWVEPRLLAEIEYAKLTSDGLVRQGSFIALRDDKSARQVHAPRAAEPPVTAPKRRTRKDADTSVGAAMVQSPPTAPKRRAHGNASTSASATVAGVPITHPDRVFADAGGVTKLELAQYYAALGERFVGEVRGRPLVLVRCPGGDFSQCFFQRHASAGLDVENIAPRPGAENVIVLQTLPAAVSCVQNGTIEFHTWGATIPNLAQPDRFVLDLDPDPALPWAKVREGCELVRAVLDHLELEWFVKTTGGKGLHFVVPLVRRHTWDEVKDFTGAIARHLARTLPSLFTATMSKARRAQRIYVDYLRNAEQASAVAAYSARARAGLPVSTPIDWAELARDVRGAHFNVRNVPQRLAKQKRDPWSAYARSAQRISAAMRRALEP